LFFDIETAPNIGVFFSAGYKLNIGYQSIIKERAIICICYKWEGDSEVTSLEWDENQCDKKMLEKFIQVANTADEMVGHNGLKFDLNWIRTRCLFHKIDMFPSYIVIDTLTIARAKFRFNSNKLDYIAKFLGIGKKIKTDFDLWKNILLNKDKIAMAKMVKYCKGDVILLQKVYDRLKNHIIVKSHFGKVFHQDKRSCPECGSDELNIKGYKYTAAGTKKVQYQCKICHKYHSKTEK
jgi:uncharacterized protein YprB with RNaseH-like and TPR domain